MIDINEYLEETEFENVYVVKKWDKNIIEKYLALGCQLVGMFFSMLNIKFIPVILNRANQPPIFNAFRHFKLTDFGFASLDMINEEIKLNFRFIYSNPKTVMDKFLDAQEIFFYD